MDTIVELEPVAVKLEWSPQLDGIVARLAERAGQPKEEWLKRLLLEAIEDAEDYQIAEDAMKEYERGGEKAKTLEEASRELGLDD